MLSSAVVKTKCTLDGNTKALGRIFADHGYRLYLVGGAVRDYLMGIPNDDYDFATDARPHEVMAMFPHHVIPTGLQHGTVTVRFRRQSYEVTTFRSEGGYSDSRHPDSVTFVRSLESDLERRDFTINALAADTLDGTIIDHHDGRGDLHRRLIRAIGDPDERFAEDALRMLRACRFAARLDFDIDRRTFEAMKRLSSTLTRVSAERIRDELYKTLMSDHPSRGIELMRTSGLLDHILPELVRCVAIAQGGMHSMDVYHHSLAALDESARHAYPLAVRLAALLHDIGKPSCRVEGEDRCTFHGHDIVGGEMVDGIMRRMKSSNEERQLVSLLVRQHMFNYTPSWSDGAVRRFINRVGKDNLEALFQLRIADACAISGTPSMDGLWELEERIRAILHSSPALTVRDLAVDGHDLMAAGIKPGPVLGRTLSALLEAVLDDPSLNDKDTLTALALGLHS